MTTTFESDWENKRLQEEIESLRAKVAELEAENQKLLHDLMVRETAKDDRIAELEAENARLDKGWAESSVRILELQLEANHEAVEPVAVGEEWTPCMKLPVVVHVRKQREGEAHVSTREGITPVKPDDLIMRGVSGEEYPIGRAIFEQTYTLNVEQDTQPPKHEADRIPLQKVIAEMCQDPAFKAVYEEQKALLTEALNTETALARFHESGGDEEKDPVERLRFFCSLAMSGQDWLDVEQFFDALPKHEAVEPVAWMGRDNEDFSYKQSEYFTIPLYTQPPSTQAAVAAALRKAVECYDEEKVNADETGQEADFAYNSALEHAKEAILALPHDDSHLRELMMRVAREVYMNAKTVAEMQEIVDRVLKGQP